MYNQHALIVDDSKTAQLRLKRMLESYQLEIDIASSAEEALAYLSYRAPAVIFLDQSMKGMDGIEALRTIKANPGTATIPVIMYTSEKGNVFTGQARALGALDILYKSTLKPSSLEKVLSTLKIPAKGSNNDGIETADDAFNEPTAAATPPPSNQPDLSEIRAQIARLFEIHIADVGRQITKSTQFIVKRLAANQQDKTPAPPTEIMIGDVPLSVLNDEVAAERRRVSIVSNSLLAVTLVGLLGIGVLLFNLSQNLKGVTDNYRVATAVAEMNAAQINQLAEELYSANRIPANNAMDSRIWLDIVTWAADNDFSFGYGEEPLNENTMSKFQHMLYMVSDAGFQGVIELRINFGNLCLTIDDMGQQILAPDSLPIAECIFKDALNEDIVAENYLSLAYLSFEQLAPPLREGNISLAVSTSGLGAPRIEHTYPNSRTTAGDWNKVALQNNYVSFLFHGMDG